MMMRKLGANGPAVSAIGLGCMGMSEFYGPTDDARSIAVIHHALDRGMNFFDTADMYGCGRNEELLGRALTGRRNQAVIATKFAVVRDAAGGFGGISGKPAYVKEACEASLRRLAVDAIDLYYQHRVDPEVPIEETVSAMAELVKQGKVKHLGLSEASPATIRRAHAVHPIAALQTEFSLWSRDPEKSLLATCAELGIAFVAYSPLGRGFLTGALKSAAALAPNDFRRTSPRMADDNLPKNLELVAALEAIAKQKQATPAQIALRWILARDPNTIAIPGTTRKERLDENLAAADVSLGAEDLDALDRLFPPGAAAGERYNAGGLSSVDR